MQFVRYDRVHQDDATGTRRRGWSVECGVAHPKVRSQAVPACHRAPSACRRGGREGSPSSQPAHAR